MTSKHLDEDIYQQALAESVHYSLKTVNSNIEKGGIVKDFDKKLSINDVKSKLEIKSNAQTPNKNNLIGIVKVPKNV